MEVGKSTGHGSIPRKLFSCALTLYFSSVLQVLNGSVNSMWVGRYLGEEALAATSIANTVIVLLVGSAFGITMAATIHVAHCIGAGQVRDAKRALGTSLTVFAIISIGAGVAGVALCEPILTLLKTPAETLPLAASYMRVILYSLPSLFSFMSVMSVLRGAGDFKTPLYFSVLMVLIDVALNPVLIFGVGPIPALGIVGSALATAVAQATSLIGLVLYVYKLRHTLCLRGNELSLLLPEWRIASALIRKGIPISGYILVLSLNGVLMISLVDHFGVDTVAAFGASIQIWNYIPMLAVAVGTAASTMAAQSIGAAKWTCVESLVKTGVLFSVCGSLVLVLAIEILDTRAFGLLLPSHSPALDISSHINRIVNGSWVVAAVPPVLFGVIRAAGEVMAPLWIAIFAVLAIQFPLAYSLQSIWGADAIWWSYPISATLNAALAVLYYLRGGWRNIRAHDTRLVWPPAV